MKRILVSVTNDLVTDQRVHKVCTTLTQMNFDILLIGRKLKNSKPLTRKYKTYRFKLLFNKGFLFYAEYNFRLFFILLFSKKDILLANDLDTLLPNYLVSRISKSKLVYDSHELFSELPEIINRPFVQNFWLRIERYILPKLRNCYTVCESIAKYYKSKYNVNFRIVKNYPVQIYQLDKSSFPFDIKKNKIILYQGAINIGRGLELMIETMLYIDNALFVIIGNGEIDEQIKQQVVHLKLEDKIKFISKKTPTELLQLTPIADLGISLEEDLGLNYRYALPNKIFDYIQAKIPILISNLPEMKKIIDNYKVGEIILDRNPKKLAIQINHILQRDKCFYSKRLEIASEELIWENESKKLIKIFKKN
ncbi:MAG: glycosyltransferase [Bacteroidetes bacterium]|nr:glycosyltransferase [Bacteroidota bacterium]